jgi:FixJ family two-component response regulator
MNTLETIVYIIDDDELVRDSLQQLIKSVGLNSEEFSSAEQFLANFSLPDVPCCIVSDIRMPGLSGLDLQNKLLNLGHLIPIIFITGHGTVPMSVRALKQGAIDFLQKPFEDQDIIDAIHQAIDNYKKNKVYQDEIKITGERLKSLTKREHQVLECVSKGLLNKDIAKSLDMSESTVKTHRSHTMQKMKAKSLAQLIQSLEKYKIFSPNHSTLIKIK